MILQSFPDMSLLLHELSMGCSFLQDMSTCCSCSPRLQHGYLLPHGLQKSVLWRLDPSFCTDTGVCAAASLLFFSFLALKYSSPEVAASIMSCLCGAWVGSSWDLLYLAQDSLTRATPAVPPLPHKHHTVHLSLQWNTYLRIVVKIYIHHTLFINYTYINNDKILQNKIKVTSSQSWKKWTVHTHTGKICPSSLLFTTTNALPQLFHFPTMSSPSFAHYLSHLLSLSWIPWFLSWMTKRTVVNWPQIAAKHPPFFSSTPLSLLCGYRQKEGKRLMDQDEDGLIRKVCTQTEQKEKLFHYFRWAGRCLATPWKERPKHT